MTPLFYLCKISKKNLFDRKTKILAHYSGQRVGTADTILSLVRPLEIEISKKNFWAEKRKCSKTAQGTMFGPLTPFTCERYQKIMLWPKNENARILLRLPLWHGLHLPFTCATFRNWDIEEKFIGPKNENARILLGAPRLYHRHVTFTCARYRCKKFRTEKRKYSFTVQGTALEPLHLPFTCATSWNQDIKEKFIGPKNEKARTLLGAPCLYNWHVSFTARNIEENNFGPKSQNTRTLLMAPRWYRWHFPFSCERYRRKNVLKEKRKCSHTVQGTALASLKPPFHLCHLKNSRYRRKNFWAEKRKCSKTTQGNAFGPLTPSFYLWKISKKKCFDWKTKMLAFGLGHWVGTADTSFSLVRLSEIKIL